MTPPGEGLFSLAKTKGKALHIDRAQVSTKFSSGNFASSSFFLIPYFYVR
jgi:hypothetical protein